MRIFGFNTSRRSGQHNGRADAPEFGDDGYDDAPVDGARYDDAGYDQQYAPAPGQQSYLDQSHGEQPFAGQDWLTAHDVKKTYGKRMVVKGVSLAVARGESVGLLGPNGAGKTTVFYMITGLVPADHGHIFIDGRDVTTLPMYRRARLGIGYLPQEASIFRGLTEIGRAHV